MKVDTGMSRMKPLHLQWVVGLYDYLRNKANAFNKFFVLAGIAYCIDNDHIGPQ